MKKLFTLFVIIALTLDVIAQSPQRLSYQAVIRNSSGQLITNHAVGMRISILQGSETGTPVYIETQVPSTNENGLITLEIGGGIPVTGTFTGIDWSNGTYFIKTETDPTGGASYSITGTSKILSVPYAFYAKTAKTADYNELTNKPLLFDGTWTSLTGKPSFAPVATSGAFADLLSKPTTLSGYGITDAMKTTHPANAITSVNIANWTTSYGWGNHATAGYAVYPSQTGNSGKYLKTDGTNTSWSKLAVQGETGAVDEVLFEVKNKYGQTIFAVYNEGVRIWVDDGAKGPKGGFAVGGFDMTKATKREFFIVSDDSVRIYLDTNPDTKKPKGGFAVGGFDMTKGEAQNFLNLTPENYFIGHQAGISNTTGLYNSFIGYQGGFNNTTGYNNVTQGFKAGYSNIAGYNNVFMGNLAGFGNTGGFSNTFIGNQAGYSNSTGFFNIFIGEQAGISNTTASRNVFLGQLSGRYNTTGETNVFIGQQAGEANITGSFNLFAGRNAGNFNTYGQLNTFLGINAGNGNTTGNYNVNLGGESGKLNSTGSNNVNLGTGAGYGNTNGNNNINIGYYTGISLNSGSGNIFIGPGAGGGLNNASDRLFIENSNADANNALIYGEFDNNKLRFNGNVGINTDAGTLKLSTYDDRYTNDDPAIQGQHNVQAYYGIGLKGSGGWMGVNGEATLNGTGARFGVYGNASGGTSNYGVYGVASGTDAYAGYFSGNVNVTGTFTNVSDRGLKKNIKPIDGSLHKILDLQGITFEWKSEAELPFDDLRKKGDMKETDIRSFNFPDGVQFGVIAQDVEKVLPDLVHTDAYGLKSVDYIKMIPLMIEAIKEQQKQIESAKQENQQLKSELAELKTLVNSLKVNQPGQGNN